MREGTGWAEHGKIADGARQTIAARRVLGHGRAAALTLQRQGAVYIKVDNVPNAGRTCATVQQ